MGALQAHFFLYIFCVLLLLLSLLSLLSFFVSLYFCLFVFLCFCVFVFLPFCLFVFLSTTIIITGSMSTTTPIIVPIQQFFNCTTNQWTRTKVSCSFSPALQLRITCMSFWRALASKLLNRL